MKIKSKISDFIVRELLDEGYLRPSGRHRVYRVTKRKLTTLEAARALAEEAGVPAAEVGLAGLKDRQGVTTQFMSVERGKPVFVKAPELRIESAGFANERLESRHSRGNSFEITVRGLERGDRARIEEQLADVREHGIPNYFGEQRFGNVKHGQGWIARELALGRHEKALHMLLAGPSAGDDERTRRFKSGLDARWGDWRACREIAGRFGQHISVFEHLARSDGDFAGAFRFVASRLRLIHLYAWQSHVWNRALARLIDHAVPRERRFAVTTPEGLLVFHARGPLELDPAMRDVLRLPGEGLQDVEHPLQRDLLALALRDEGLQPGEFRIAGVPGFQLKGEDRAIVVRPRALEVLPGAREDGHDALVLRFELPRGAYATLVLARLVPSGVHAPRPSDQREQRGQPSEKSPARRDSRGTSARAPRDGGPRTRDGGPRAREAAPRAREGGPSTRERGPRARDSGPRARASGPHAREGGPRAREGGSHAREERSQRDAEAPAPRRARPHPHKQKPRQAQSIAAKKRGKKRGQVR